MRFLSAPRWPVRIVNHIPGADWIALVIEQNPQLLAVVFQLNSPEVNDIATQLKIAENTQVTTDVAATDRFYGQRQFILRLNKLFDGR